MALLDFLRKETQKAGRSVGQFVNRASDNYNPFDKQYQQKAVQRNQNFARNAQTVQRGVNNIVVQPARNAAAGLSIIPQTGYRASVGLGRQLAGDKNGIVNELSKQTYAEKTLGNINAKDASIRGILSDPNSRRIIGQAASAPTYLYAGAKGLGNVAGNIGQRVLNRSTAVIPEALLNTGLQQFEQGNLKNLPQNAAMNIGTMAAFSNLGGVIGDRTRAGKGVIGATIQDVSKKADIPVKGGQIQFDNAEDFIANKVGGKVSSRDKMFTQQVGMPPIDKSVPESWGGLIGRGKEITTPNNRMALRITEDTRSVYLPGIATEKTGTGLGTKAMDALKEYADAKGKSIEVYKVTNPDYFKKINWLTEKNGSFSYDPLSSAVKGGVDKVTNALGKNVDQAKFEAGQLADLNKIAPERGASIASPAIPAKTKPLVTLNSKGQKTTNVVDRLKITGENVKDRVASARANSENVRQQIVQRGQDAYIAGQKLKDAELRVIRDAYQGGKSIDDIAKNSSNPKVVKNYLEKLQDYYDFELAADRSVGGTTLKESSHLRQIWDLSDPAKKAQFDEIAKQRGLDNYSGYGTQPKVFKSYAEGEALGFKPKNRNINEDLLQHSQGASEAIGKRQLVNGLQEAAPGQVTAAGMGRTAEGKAYENLNIKGMEDVAVSPEVAANLKGYAPIKVTGASAGTDFIKMAKKEGANGARNVGVGQYIDRATGTVRAIPKAAKDAGFKGVMGSLYDHSSQELKKILLNMSFFHVLNVGETNLGRIVSHPIKGSRSMLQAIGSLPSEKVAQANIKYYKAKMIPGTNMSVFDAALASGQNMTRGLPVKGAGRLNVLGGTGRATFDRFIYTLQMGLNDQIYGNGKINPNSPQGRALGKEIELAVGKLNTITNNIDPNTMKWFSRGVLAPQYTASKYKMLWDSVSKWGVANKANASQGNFARSTVAGEAFAVGTIATFGTLIATGEFPELNQILMNYTISPKIETNMKNTKGENIDITPPKTFLSEPGSIIKPAIEGNTWEQKTEGLVHAGQSRLNPILADTAKIVTNKNYYGENVVPTGMNTLDSIKTMGADILQGRTPIGAQSILRAIEGKDTPAQAAIGIIGARTTTNRNAPSQIYSNVYDIQTAIDDVVKNLKTKKITEADATKRINELTAKRDSASAKLGGVTSPISATGGRSYIKADGSPGWAKNEEAYQRALITEETTAAKERVAQTGKRENVNGTLVWLGDDGEVHTKKKETILKEAEDYKLTTGIANAKESGDLNTYVKLSETKIQKLMDKLDSLDPEAEAVQILQTQEQIQTIVDNIAKYKGYGGFKKPKKGSLGKSPKLSLGKVSSPTIKSKGIKLKNSGIARGTAKASTTGIKKGIRTIKNKELYG